MLGRINGPYKKIAELGLRDPLRVSLHVIGSGHLTCKILEVSAR